MTVEAVSEGDSRADHYGQRHRNGDGDRDACQPASLLATPP
jgi:hypothetical protein